MQSLMRWLARRPLTTLHAWGALLGWLAYLLSPRYRKRLRTQVAAAGYGPTVRREAVHEAGRMVAELPWLWLRPASRPLGGLATLGLDFAMVVTFIGIVVPLIRTRPMLLSALVAALVSVLAYQMPNKGGLMVAALAGIAAGVALEWWRDQEKTG